MGDEFHFLFKCNGLEKLRILVIPKYYRTRCSTLKMTQLLNTNDRKLLMKVAKFVHLGMKEYTSLPDVSEISLLLPIQAVCIPNHESKQIHSMYNIDTLIFMDVPCMYIFVMLTTLLMVVFFLMILLYFISVP